MQYYLAKRQALSNTPHDYYYDNAQALIDYQWDNTTTLQSIQEECPVKSFNFRDIQVRMTHALDRSTNMKQGSDFRKLIFQDLTYNVSFGTYYLFEDAYWLTINLDQFNRTEKNVIVRRCNNYLKWKDENEVIHSYPCILEYEVTASSQRVDNNIITPNNKVRAIVQANDETLTIGVNKRFIFGDRPFTVIGLNNYMIDTIDGTQSIMYIHTQLDEILPYDDFVNNIAYNTNVADEQLGENEDYIETDDRELMSAAIVENGDYTYVSLIADISQLSNKIVINPAFNQLRQNYTVVFDASLYIDSVKQDDVVNVTTAGAPDWTYSFEELGNNKFKLTCKKVSQIPLELTFSSRDITKFMFVDLKSMF